MDTYENNGLNQPEPAELTEQPELEAPITQEMENEPETPVDVIDLIEIYDEFPQEAPVQPELTPEPEPTKKDRKRMKVILAAALVLALVIGSCVATALLINNYWEKRFVEYHNMTRYGFLELNKQIEDLQAEIKDNAFTGNGNSVSGTPNATPDGSLTPAQVYAKNVKAVVAISNHATTNIYGQITETASSGSGFIISEDGYVVTNHHVIEGATKLTVILHDGEEYVAKVIGYDAGNDVALLKIDATGLPFVKLGSSKDLIVGDQVVAIGNPLGELTNSLTVGYVSALERGIHSGGAQINMIQTDAAINSGNSGGPLFNMKGEVVGITTAKYSGTTGSGAIIEGIGFAVPFDDVRKKVMDLKEYGYLRGAYLGITVTDAPYSTGAMVRDVTPGYCAAKGGLRANDIIQSLGGYKVTCMNDLSRALEHYSAGDTIEILVLRASKLVLVTVTLDERPHMTNTDAVEPSEPAETQPTIPDRNP